MKKRSTIKAFGVVAPVLMCLSAQAFGQIIDPSVISEAREEVQKEQIVEQDNTRVHTEIPNLDLNAKPIEVDGKINELVSEENELVADDTVIESPEAELDQSIEEAVEEVKAEINEEIQNDIQNDIQEDIQEDIQNVTIEKPQIAEQEQQPEEEVVVDEEQPSEEEVVAEEEQPTEEEVVAEEEQQPEEEIVAEEEQQSEEEEVVAETKTEPKEEVKEETKDQKEEEKESKEIASLREDKKGLESIVCEQRDTISELQAEVEEIKNQSTSYLPMMSMMQQLMMMNMMMSQQQVSISYQPSAVDLMSQMLAPTMLLQSMNLGMNMASMNNMYHSYHMPAQQSPQYNYNIGGDFYGRDYSMTQQAPGQQQLAAQVPYNAAYAYDFQERKPNFGSIEKAEDSAETKAPARTPSQEESKTESGLKADEEMV